MYVIYIRRRFGDIATEHSGGMDNPVYGSELYGDTPLHDVSVTVCFSLYTFKGGATLLILPI